MNPSYLCICLISLCGLLQSRLLLLSLQIPVLTLPWLLSLSLPHSLSIGSSFYAELLASPVYVSGSFQPTPLCTQFLLMEHAFLLSFGELWLFLEDFVQKLLPQLSPPFFSGSCPLGLGPWKTPSYLLAPLSSWIFFHWCVCVCVCVCKL